MWWILIFLVIVILTLIVIRSYFSEYIPDNIKPFLFIKTPEKYTVLSKGLSLGENFDTAVHRSLVAGTRILEKYINNITDADREQFIKSVKDSIEVFKVKLMTAQGDRSIFLQAEGANAITDAIKNAGMSLVEKSKGSDAAASFVAEVDSKVRTIASNVINYNIESNPLSVSNIVYGSLMDKVMDFHMGKLKDGKVTQSREVKPYVKKGNKIDINEMYKNPIVNMIHNEFPSITNAQALLPKIDNNDPLNAPINLEIANLIASTRRFDIQPTSIVFDRGSDIRPLPAPLIDKIVATNGKDPNSLQSSALFNARDLVESARGIAGNEYIDQTLEKLWRSHDYPYSTEFDKMILGEQAKSQPIVDARNQRDVTNQIIASIKLKS